jgi:hypothetical protein
MLLATKQSNHIKMLEQLNHEELTQKQIEAVKERAIELWGDKWLPQLVREYARVTGTNERSKFAQVQRYFKGGNSLNLESMNALLLAVNCKFQMVCYAEPKVKEF